MNYEQRQTWANHTRNQSCEPLRLYRPTALNDVRHIVRAAESANCTCRAVGSGHAWSDVALTHGFLVETHGLDRILELDNDLLRPDVDPQLLVRTEAGIKLRALNEVLDQRGLALANMGGYDEQTVAGVMATSTHGSGLEFGPLSSFARSIDLVASGARLLRIEPTNGITDSARFGVRFPEWKLVQDDDWFRAVSVGMGCLGIVYAVTLAVEPAYWLTETRRLSDWSTVKRDLESGEVLRSHRHYEVYFNPYRVKQRDAKCLVTTRVRAASPEGKPKKHRQRNPISQQGSSLPVVPSLINLVLDLWPRLSPRVIDMALKTLEDPEYSNKSYKVLNIGAPNKLPAYSSEIGVPVDGRHIQAVELIMAIAQKYLTVGQAYHTSPIALRFVRASDAYLSMMHGRDTMMIELIQMTDTEGGIALLTEYEEELYKLGGRPHWGQINFLTGSHNLVGSMYPQYSRWLAVHDALNETGVFDSPFSKRVGISRSAFVP